MSERHPYTKNLRLKALAMKAREELAGRLRKFGRRRRRWFARHGLHPTTCPSLPSGKPSARLRVLSLPSCAFGWSDANSSPHILKTGVVVRLPWVRIPPPPPKSGATSPVALRERPQDGRGGSCGLSDQPAIIAWRAFMSIGFTRC